MNWHNKNYRGRMLHRHTVFQSPPCLLRLFSKINKFSTVALFREEFLLNFISSIHGWSKASKDIFILISKNANTQGNTSLIDENRQALQILHQVVSNSKSTPSSVLDDPVLPIQKSVYTKSTFFRWRKSVSLVFHIAVMMNFSF